MQRDLLAANAAFYDAFARRDIASMDRLWARRAPVACIHPGWNALRGREQVMSSWHGILGGGGGPQIRCSRATAHVLGDAAYVICIESLPGADLIATNLFVEEDGEWRMVHHQASPMARSAAAEDSAESEDDEEPDDDDDGSPGMN